VAPMTREAAEYGTQSMRILRTSLAGRRQAVTLT
jgi:hypothetical protein